MIKARAIFDSLYESTEVKVDLQTNEVKYHEQTRSAQELLWRVPIYGSVYGAALNYKGELEAMGNNLHEDPYKAPPTAPVLYMKPVNTFNAHQSDIHLPSDVSQVQVGAALGVVVKKKATEVTADTALDYIEGYTIANDVTIPHESLHRPAIKHKARDGFCPIGPWVVQKEHVTNPDQLDIHVYVNSECKQKNTTEHLVRNVPQLIEDVTQFMTLNEGDVLLVGTPEHPPLVKAGDRVRIEIAGLGALENTVVAQS